MASPWTPPTTTSTSSWSDAPEFVPKSPKPCEEEAAKDSKEAKVKSWAQVVNSEAKAEITIEDAESQLCPFSLMDECRYGQNCAYVHGLIFDMCNQPTLHPTHEAQRKS